MTAVTEKLIVEKKLGIGTIVFNNQDRRNALTLEMWQGIPIILEDFSKDPEVRVVVISGAGSKAFCAGADISQFAKNRSTQEAVSEYDEAVELASNSLSNFNKPTIAKIEGVCVGGGLGIALCCDLRIANEQAIFSVPAGKLGLGYKANGLRRLVNIVGPSMAKEIFFTARIFSSQEAASMGLVNRILPKTVLTYFVHDYAKTIADNAPLTIHAAKVVIDQLMLPSNQFDPEICQKVVDDCFASKDYIEGRTAFMEKRKPNFTGN